jgi:hypothetical protein
MRIGHSRSPEHPFVIPNKAGAGASPWPELIFTKRSVVNWPLWSADRPHLPVAEIAHWFATYVYLPKLRDRVVLESAIRDALAKLDPKFAYAEGFDQATGKYAGLLWQKRRSVRCRRLPSWSGRRLLWRTCAPLD